MVIIARSDVIYSIYVSNGLFWLCRGLCLRWVCNEEVLVLVEHLANLYARRFFWMRANVSSESHDLLLSVVFSIHWSATVKRMSLKFSQQSFTESLRKQQFHGTLLSNSLKASKFAFLKLYVILLCLLGFSVWPSQSRIERNHGQNLICLLLLLREWWIRVDWWGEDRGCYSLS